ncbi:cell division protein FtsX [Microbacter margulisiae]|uniref:Cell division protein FtsX n=1 Tax=Microbacter margulisiae TaxID=1350067 RepID=A0A7W5H2M6_9PORP|nr:permease-like cell division protein FtsX [Microbacter margulisiae]MBB3187744.1 cell division transport system permease protein [Microbacter margulisiae]MBB3188778.1 cell division transport system permease protein [Microbacter margulisiae]
MSHRASRQKKRFFNLHVISTISIAFVLFLIGLISILVIIGNDVSNYVKENVNMSVVIEDSISPHDLQVVQQLIQTMPGVKSYEYISKEQALKDHIRDLGENPADFLGYNPLLASFEVKLTSFYANTDSVSHIEKRLKKYAGVKQVIYQKDIIQLVNDNLTKTGYFLMGIAAILIFISTVLLNNTIRLSIYSKRFVINTMRLVGAKAWFIRRAFVWRYLWNGLIAAVIALALLGVAAYYVQIALGVNFNLYNLRVELMVSGVVVLFGLLISFFAALFAVNRYIRMRTNDMYFI